MGVDIQGKLRQALGSVKDRASIGKAMIYSTHDGKGFSDIEIAVVRATGHDNGPIDDKHMHEILFLVSNSPGSIPFLAERLSRRLAKTRDRLVALKTLLLIHRLLRGGNRCFEQQLRSAHVSGHLQMSSRWFLRNSDPALRFLQTYAAYLEERVDWVINQAGKLEPAVLPKGLEVRCYKDKSIDMVFRKLPKCQELIDRVLNCSSIFDVLPSDNNLVQAAMCNTLKESFQVYMTFSEGVAALVNMLFDLTRSARALACDILRKASRQSQGLHDLYDKCRRVMENKSLKYPSVQVITTDHVMALEQCSSYIPNSSISQTCSTHAQIWDRVTRSTELQGPIMGQKDESGHLGFSSTLFSCTLETKISKVWVVFEDEDLKVP